MPRTYNVVDADAHILEPLDLWEHYLEPAFRDRAPKLITDNDGKQRLLIARPDTSAARRVSALAGAIGARDGVVCDDTMEYQPGQPGGFDPHKRIPDMDFDGIDAAFLYPTPRLVERRDPRTRRSPRRAAAPTTAGSPITASRIPTGCLGWRCCRCNRSSWRSRK